MGASGRFFEFLIRFDFGLVYRFEIWFDSFFFVPSAVHLVRFVVFCS